MNFEELVRSSSAIHEVHCPGCEGEQVEKQISRFAARVEGGSRSLSFGSSAASCNTGST
jgi:hypothetical protein